MTPQDPDTSSFPASPAPQPGHQPAGEGPRREGSLLAAFLLGALVVAAIALGVWLFNGFLGGDSDDEQPPTVTSTAAPTPTSPEETTESPTPEPEPEPETEVVTVTTTAAAPGVYSAPASAVQCAANVNWRIYRANDRTSCGFAESVAVQMAPYAGLPGSAQVEAYSPATGQAYLMNCITQGGNSYVCQGGDNAVVILESRGVRD